MPESPTSLPNATSRSNPEHGQSHNLHWLLAALLVVSLLMQVWATQQLSLTGDGAVHLIAGHQALRYGENLINWEHPPLVKLIMATPASVFSEALLPPLEAKDTFEASGQLHERPAAMLRATVAGRALAHLLITIPALFACYWLGRRFGGPFCGLVVVLILTLSFSTLGTFSILQTDGGALFGYAGTLCLALSYLDRPSVLRALALGTIFGLGLAAKFSVVLLGPTVVLTFGLATLGSGLAATWKLRLREIVVMGATAFIVLMSVYGIANRNVTKESNGRVLEQYINNQASLIAGDELKRHAALLRRIADVSPSASQYATGFLGIRAQNSIGVYPSFAFGEVSSQGRWWYFPAVFLAKAPLPLLLALLFLFPAQIKQLRSLPRPALSVIASLVLIYGLIALTSKYNLGYRHLLPITPMVMLPLAMTLARRKRTAVLLLTLLAVESLWVAPLWISRTNTWWLGTHNPTRLSFSGGNLEYAQNFITLADNLPGDEPVQILIPGKDTRTLAAYMPNAVSLAPGTTTLEPGLYAVSVLVEQYVPALPRSDPDKVHGYDSLKGLIDNLDITWKLIQRGEDLGYVADTFRLYRLTSQVSAGD